MDITIIKIVTHSSSLLKFEQEINKFTKEGWTPQYESFRINKNGKYFIILSNYEPFIINNATEIIRRNDLKE
ncbi:MAG: hypothetical protein DDT40_00832 [candidate division WS2 bacterium]|nr:hypothetical protein [Candidatus Psychracetigena formicireducens]